MCSMLTGSGGSMMGMSGGMSGSSSMGGMGGMGGMTAGHNVWQARQMTAAGGMSHMGYGSGHGHQQHDAKMAEKIITELQVGGESVALERKNWLPGIDFVLEG